MKRILTYFLILAILAGAAFFVYKFIEKQKNKVLVKAGQTAVPVQVVPAVMHEFQIKIAAVGTLKAREINLLSPKVAGNVDQVMADIGDFVKADQVVVVLDKTRFKIAVNQASAAYNAARASVGRAKSQFDQAQKEYNRAKKLLFEKVIPQSRFDNAEAAYKATREAMAAAKGQYEQAGAALETPREHLRDTSIRSSISGTVVNRNVEIGQSVSPGVQVLRILDQTTVKSDIELPEKDFGQIKPGISAVMKADAFPEQEFFGKVTIVNPMVDPGVRTFRVRIEAENPDEKLVDGMFIRVEFMSGRKNVLSIPRDALQRLPGSGTYYVFVVDQNKAFKRIVITGLIDDLHAEIKDGLVKGEKVVISGTGKLRSGMKVIVTAKNNNGDRDKITSDLAGRIKK
ncbi:MAG: efflux RND transporter periplasmic adaptor subunit [Desulfosarcina sp.]|nr:efflux RND transporter periplasmic adaptor subunit [Desulfobacterales bacterium]